MNDLSQREHAVDLLQSLGLKEYEAKCFVALSRVDSATAKDVSELSEVPRTRVYDAVRVLETKGLVETQHSNPQRFRAVSIEEATQTLQNEYEDRVTDLEDTLQDVQPVTDEDEDEDVTHEVWAITGSTAIGTRTLQLVEDADDEIVLVLSSLATLTDDLVVALREKQTQDVRLVLGAADTDLRDAIRDRLSDADVFVSELDWLRGSDGDETDISRLLLVDGSTILVSSTGTDDAPEQAVFGRGFTNGLVTIVRRLMSSGLFGEPADAVQD